MEFSIQLLWSYLFNLVPKAREKRPGDEVVFNRFHYDYNVKKD